MRISDFEDYAFDDLDANRQRYDLFVKFEPKKHINNFNGVDVYELRIGGEDILVGLYHPTKLVVYYCNYEVKVEPNAGRTCTQIMLWSKRSKRVKDLPRIIFFNYLMKKYKTMQTDTMQTPDGERFWLGNIRTAFDVGYNVYHYNNASHKLAQLSSYDEFKEYYLADAFWGSQFSHGDITILISSKDLKTS
jgi:hypothetical protein